MCTCYETANIASSLFVMQPLNSRKNPLLDQVFAGQWCNQFLLPQDRNLPTVCLTTPHFQTNTARSTSQSLSWIPAVTIMQYLEKSLQNIWLVIAVSAEGQVSCFTYSCYWTDRRGWFKNDWMKHSNFPRCTARETSDVMLMRRWTSILALLILPNMSLMDLMFLFLCLFVC